MPLSVRVVALSTVLALALGATACGGDDVPAACATLAHEVGLPVMAFLDRSPLGLTAEQIAVEIDDREDLGVDQVLSEAAENGMSLTAASDAGVGELGTALRDAREAGCTLGQLRGPLADRLDALAGSPLFRRSADTDAVIAGLRGQTAP